MNPQLPLRDIHLPPEPSWWPPAPGWWLLAALLLLLSFVLYRYVRRIWRQRRLRRTLLAEVDAIWDRHADADAGVAIVSAWSALMRRACRRWQPQLATCEGVAWAEALDFANGDAGLQALLLDAPFRRRLPREAVAALREPVRLALRQLSQPNPRKAAR